MGLRSFFGILPPRLAYWGAATPVERLPVPSKVVLVHPGSSPDLLAVRPGSGVKTGQVLGRQAAGPFISTVTGRVGAVEVLRGSRGDETLAVQIAAEGREDLDLRLTATKDFSMATPAFLRAAIQRAGFSEMASISPEPSEWPVVEALIVSALDRDPSSCCNQQIFREHHQELGACVQLLTRATEVKTCVVAVPEHLAQAATGSSGATVCAVKAVYPNGLPEILARKYGRGAPLKARNGAFTGNTLVVGFEHALGMVECLRSGRPFLEKIVSVSAGNQGQVKNYGVRIGTPVGEVLKKANLTPGPGGKIILNGMMKGYACFSDEQPVTGETDAVHVQSGEEVFLYQNQQCIMCGKCNAICPVGLEVNLLARFSEYGIFEKCKALVPENCIECGLCAYVCPAHRPLVHFISHAKQILRTLNVPEMSMAQALSCESCGHVCPAIRLFDTSAGDAPCQGKGPIQGSVSHQREDNVP